MIENLTPLKVVYCSKNLYFRDIIKWTNEKNLILGDDFEFYGRTNKGNNLSFGFKDHNIAMLFKLTFSGL